MDNEEILIRAILEDLVSGPLKQIADAAQNLATVMDAAMATIQEAITALDTSTATATDNFNNVTTAATAADDVLTRISATIDAMNTPMGAAVDTTAAFNESLSEVASNLTTSVDPAVQQLATSLSQATDSIGMLLLGAGETSASLSDLQGQLAANATAFTDFAAILGANSDAVARLNALLGDSAATIAELNGLVSSNVSSFAEESFALTTLNDSFYGLSAATDAFYGSSENAANGAYNASAAFDGYSASAEGAAGASSAFVDATFTVEETVRASGTAAAGATAGVDSYAASLRAAAIAADTAAVANDAAKPSFNSTGYGAILGATSMLVMAGAAVRLGINMVKAGADSENALVRVASLTGTNTQQMEQYKQAIERMAETIGATIPDLSAGLYDILSVGYTGADAMMILRNAAMAAAAGGTDLHTVTNGLTSIMKAFAFSGKDAAAAVNILMMGVREGKAPFADFSRAIGLVANVSHEAGFKIGEVTAALATMTVVYPTVRQAGQNLQALITNIGIQTDKLAKRAKALKLPFDSAAFASMTLAQRLGYLWGISKHNVQTFEGLMGNITSTKAAFTLLNSADAPSIFKQLYAAVHITDTQIQAFAKHAHEGFDKAKYDAMSVTDKIKYLSEISKGNANAFRLGTTETYNLSYAFAYASGIGADFARNLAQMQNVGALTADAFKKHSETLVGAMQRIQGTISVLDMNFAAVLEPDILKAMNAIGDILVKVADLFEQHANIITPLVITLAAAVGGALVGAMYALAGIMGGIMAEAMLISGIFAGVTLIVLGLGMALKNAYDHSVPFRDAVNQLWSALVTLGTSLKTAVTPILDALNVVIQHAVQWWGSLVGQVKPVTVEFQRTATYVREVNGHVVRFHQTLTGLSTTFKKTAGPLSIFVDEIKNLADAIKKIADGITAIFKPYDDYVASQKLASENAHQFNKHLHGLAPAFSSVAQHAATVQNPVIQFGKSLADVAKNVAIVAAAVGIGAVVFAYFASFLPVLPLFMKGFVLALAPITGLFFTITEAIGGFFEVVVPVFGYLFSQLGFWGVFSSLIGALWSAFASLAAVVAPVVGVFLAVAAVVGLLVAGVVMAWHQFSGLRAIFAEIAKQAGNLGAMLSQTLGPTFKDLHNIFVSQVIPAWNQLVQVFNLLKPVLTVLGGIILGVLAVALIFLISIISGLISSLRPFITGLVEVFTGAFTIIANVIKFFVDFFAGIIQLIIDLFNYGSAGGPKKFSKDLGNLFRSLVGDLIGIIHGFGAMLHGAFIAIFGTIIAFFAGFVTSVIGFFQHLADKLVGHSIVPDMLKAIVSWFFKLPGQIFSILTGFVSGVIRFFSHLNNEAVKHITALARGVGDSIGKLVHGGGLSLIHNFASGISNTFHQMSGNAIHHVEALANGAAAGARKLLTLAPPAVRQAGDAIINHLQRAEVGGLSALDNLVNGSGDRMRAMKAQAQAQSTMAQAVMVGNTIKMAQMTLQHYDQMRLGIMNQLNHTTDPVKRAALEMQLNQVDNAIKAEHGTINAAERQRAQLVQKARNQMEQASKYARESRMTVVQRFEEMAQAVPSRVAGMVTSTMGHFAGFLRQIGQFGINLKNSMVSGFENMISAITSVILGFIGKAPGLMGNLVNSLKNGVTSQISGMASAVSNFVGKAFKPIIFHSPAEEGPGAEADQWIPNLIRMMAGGFTSGSGTMNAAATSMMTALQRTIVGGTQAIGTASAGAPLSPTAIAGAGGALALRGGGGSQSVQVTINMHGGLGAGLQLLNPTERATFVKQIGDEMGRQTRLQGNYTNGYGNQ